MKIFIHLTLCMALYMAHTTHGIRTARDVPGQFIANKNCRIIISELNVHPPGGAQFLELMRVCTPSPKNVFTVSMTGKYKLAFIDHSGFLIGVFSLKNEAYRRVGEYIFYVIGGDLLEHADMHFRECDFASDADYYSPNLMPHANKAPVAVVLVHHPKAKLQWLDLKKEGGRKLKVPMTKNMQDWIIPNIVDMYVYTTSSPYTGCDHFQTYFDGYRKENYVVIRDWANTETDLSLSRCNSRDVAEQVKWDPMQPGLFLYARKSPGDVNNCQKAYRFRIEDNQRPRIPPLAHYRTTPSYSCYVTTLDPFIESGNMITSPVSYSNALKDLFAEDVDMTNECVVEPPNPAGREVAAENFNSYPLEPQEFEKTLESSVPHIWDTCDRFPDKAWILTLRSQRNPYVMADDVLRKDVCYWISYIVPDKFHCKLCHALWKQQIIFDRPGSHQLWGIKNPRPFRTGQSKKTKFKNRDLLFDHLGSPLHQISLDYYEHFDAGLRGTALHDEFYREGGPMRTYLEPTEKEFFAVYQSNRLDLPFYKHPLMAQLLIHFGVNIGFLYQNPNGAKLITTSISKTLHHDFVEDLRIRKPEVSIMIDTATDVSSIASLAILLQTYDKDGKVTVKLYRLLKVGETEGGQELFDSFKKALEEDSLLDYVKDRVAGFASDGGSNVKKFRRLLVGWTGRDNLYLVHCYAHKLDLVLKHSWEPFTNLDDVDNLANALYRLFNSKSHKRKQLLQNTAIELGDTKFELKRIIPTRWVSSKLRALRTILSHWKTLVKAVEYVLDDRTLKGPQRVNIESILQQLKDPNLIGTMAFITDACEELSILSLYLQTRGTSLIQKKESRTKLLESLVRLKYTNGKWLQWVIDNAESTEEGRKIVNLAELTEKRVLLSGIEMSFDGQQSSGLHTEKDMYIDSIREEMDWYFPKDPTDNLDIFDPRHWTQDNLEVFGNAEILSANTGLNWKYSQPQLLKDWIDLKKLLYAKPDFQRWVQKKPEDFWTFFLDEGAGVAWPQSLKKIVTNLLVVPASTAEVERIFSIYNNVKTVKRYSLDVSTVESIARIKFNGPKDLENFDASRYVKRFILEGHSRTDDRTQRRRKRPRQEEMELEIPEPEAAANPTACDDVLDGDDVIDTDEGLLPEYDVDMGVNNIFAADERNQPGQDEDDEEEGGEESGSDDDYSGSD